MKLSKSLFRYKSFHRYFFSWTPTNSQHNWKFAVYLLRCFVIIAHPSYIVTIGGPIALYVDKDQGLLRIFEIIMNIALAIFILVRAAMLFQANNLRSLERNLSKLYEHECWNREQSELNEKTLRKCDRWQLILMALAVGIPTIIIATNFPDIVKTRYIPHITWYPFDVKAPTNFEIFVIELAARTIFGHIIVLGLAESYSAATLMHILAQLRLLNLKLKTLKPIDKIPTEIEDEDEIQRWVAGLGPGTYLGSTNNHVTATEERGPKKIYRGRTTVNHISKRRAVLKKMSQKEKNMILVRWKRKIHLEMCRRFADCITHHQEIISVTREFESNFNIIFMFEIICGLVPSIGVASFISMSPTFDQRAMDMTCVLGTLMIMLFIQCSMADQINEESCKVKDAIFDCDWTEASTAFKKDMCIVISRSNSPLVISAFGFVPLSVQTFHKITETAYSYYMMLHSLAKTPE